MNVQGLGTFSGALSTVILQSGLVPLYVGCWVLLSPLCGLCLSSILQQGERRYVQCHSHELAILPSKRKQCQCVPF